MMRHLLAYMLTGILLASQVGLPVHLHYCKGVLEGISMFALPGCDEHQDPGVSDTCCKPDQSDHCSKPDNSCCKNETEVVNPDLISLAPKFNPVDQSFIIPVEYNEISVAHISAPAIASGVDQAHSHAPPIYILHQALIYYA